MFGFVLKIEIQLVCVGMSAGMYMFSVASSAVGEQGRGEREERERRKRKHFTWTHNAFLGLPAALAACCSVLGICVGRTGVKGQEQQREI